MQIKIECQGEEQVFSLSASKTTSIGRSQESDIQLSYDGISRNHVIIEEDAGSYFVTDVGSTNGTFINDDRLELNTKTPFNSFFPVKLGFNVYISLIDEVESKGINLSPAPDIKVSNDKTGQEKTNTKVTTPKKNESASAKKNDSAHVNKIKTGKKIEKEVSPFGHFMKYILVGGIIFGAYSYHQWSSEEELKKQSEAQALAQKEAEAKAEAEKAQVVAVDQNRPKLNLTLKEVENAFLEIKCSSSKEMMFCDEFRKTLPRTEGEGFYIFANIAFIYFDLKNTYLSFTEKYQYTEEEKDKFKVYAKLKYGRKTNNSQFDKTLKVAELPMNQASTVLGLFEVFGPNYAEVLKANEQIQFIVATPIIVDQNNQKKLLNPFIFEVYNYEKKPADILYILKKAILSGDVIDIEAFLKSL